MNNLTKSIFGLCAMCGALAMSSCSDNNPYIGSWGANNQSDITSQFPSASSVTSVMSIDFADNEQKTDGVVNISNVYDINETTASADSVYNIQLKATASISGIWTPDVDDSDDLLLTFDNSSLKIDIDRDGMTVVQDNGNAPSAACLDSIVNTAVTRWSRELTRAFREELSRYSVINDIEAKNEGKMLEFEIQSPETEVYFRRVEP